MPEPTSSPFTPPIGEHQCVSLVGIAGAGKSTLAPLLAARLDWGSMDTDRLMEAHFGRPLDDIYSALGREGFLACEQDIVAGLGVKRMVISTGGSVIYSPKAVARLQQLGPVIWLRVSLKTFLERVGKAHGRGFARAPEQDLPEIFYERDPLYAASADFVVDTDTAAPADCVDRIVTFLRGEA